MKVDKDTEDKVFEEMGFFFNMRDIRQQQVGRDHSAFGLRLLHLGPLRMAFPMRPTLSGLIIVTVLCMDSVYQCCHINILSLTSAPKKKKPLK